MSAAGLAATSPGPGAPEPALWDDAELQRHVLLRRDDGRAEVVLSIGGLRCSACVLALERALTGLPGVGRVQINPASRRARVVWDDRCTRLSALLAAVTRAGFRPLPLDACALDDARRDEGRDALKRLLVAGFGAAQAMMFAVVLYVGAVDPMDTTTRDLFRWLGFAVATPVVLYSGRPFFAGALRSLRARRLGMDVPVALAIALVYGASLAVALDGGGEVYFDSVSMFVFFLLAGRYLELRGRHRALDLTDALARLTPPTADRRRADGTLEQVPVAALRAGDLVRVDSGATVPADGRLESAACRVDESMLSGESVACHRGRGDELLAGSLLVEGPAELRVMRTGAATTLAGIVALVGRAQAERPRLARASERVVASFVALVLGLAAATALAWGLADPARMFPAVVAVLVVSCPCAFALAVPAAITRTLAVLAARGVLVVRPDAIEALAGATHVVFDKTGTLTDGVRCSAMRVFGAGPTREFDADRMRQLGRRPPAEPDRAAYSALRMAAALARESRHPASLAIAAAAGDLEPPRAREIRSHAGLGIEACVDGRRLRLGRPAFALRAEQTAGVGDGVVLADESGLIAEFVLEEKLRADAAATVRALVADGLTVEIASGDAPARVRRVAARLGVERWQGGLLPADKLARLRELRAAGARTVAVGDGVNDAPVLAGADIGVAMAGGTDLARAASDIVLAGERLELLSTTRELARETLATVQQNRRWALGYNLAAIPLAAFGLVPPWLAALGMSLSSLGVVLNALRIGRRRPPGREPLPAPGPAPA